MNFKYGYDLPQQAPVPKPNNPRSVQYRPMVEFYERGGSWWGKPVQRFEVYLGGTLMGSVQVLHNAGWGAWAHGLNGNKGLGIRRTRAQAAWLVLNRVWEENVHIPGRNDAYTKVFRVAPGNEFGEYLGHIVELKWDGFAVYPRGSTFPSVAARSKHRVVVALKEVCG